MVRRTVRFFKAKEVTTKVSGESIEDFAVQKVIEGNEEVKAMLERVWNKILERKPLKNGFGRVVHMDGET